jgi:hypothetical protein
MSGKALIIVSLAFFIFLHLGICSLSTQAEPPIEQTGTVVPFDIDWAMTKIFPRHGVDIQSEGDRTYITWQPEDHGYSSFFGRYEGPEVVSWILHHGPTPNSRGKNAVVIYLSYPNDWYGCHACAPMVGMATFGYEDSVWIMTRNQPNINRIGANGEVAENEVVALGPKSWGVAFFPDYMAQGFYTKHLYLIAPDETSGFTKEAIIRLTDDPSGHSMDYNTRFKSEFSVDSSRVIEGRYPLSIHRTVELADGNGEYITKKYLVDYLWTAERRYKSAPDPSVMEIEKRLESIY